MSARRGKHRAPSEATFDARTLLHTPLAKLAVELAEAVGAPAVVLRLDPSGWAAEPTDLCSARALLAKGGFHEPAGHGRVILVVADEGGAVACARAHIAPLCRGGDA